VPVLVPLQHLTASAGAATGYGGIGVTVGQPGRDRSVEADSADASIDVIEKR
jgi:hypothetical protein